MKRDRQPRSDFDIACFFYDILPLSVNGAFGDKLLPLCAYF